MPPEPTRESSPSRPGSETSNEARDNSTSHRESRKKDAKRVAIIGAGPAGLEAALYARALGMEVLIFERERDVAPGIRVWSHVAMFTPWGENRTSLGESALMNSHAPGADSAPLPASAVHPTGGEFVQSYLAPIAKTFAGSLHLDTRVVAVGRTYLFKNSYKNAPERREAYRFRILTRSPLEERLFTADYLIDASGVSHTPNWVGPGGMPAQGEMGSERHIFRNIPDVAGRDRIRFLGKSVLLVGNGASAATTALMLADIQKLEPTTTVRWATRSPAALPLPIIASDPYPRRELTMKKANLLIAGSHPGFEHFPLTQVEAVQHSLATGRFQATLQVDRVTRRIAFDAVIANVGSRPDSLTFDRILQSREPGYFVIGAKAAAESGSDFFLASCRQQIQAVFAQIAANPDLNLYGDAENNCDNQEESTEDAEAALAV